MKKTILIILTVLLISTAAIAAEEPIHTTDGDVAGYLKGKIQAEEIVGIFSQDILSLDRIARAHGSTLSDLAEKMKKDLTNLVKSKREIAIKADSKTSDATTSVMMVMFRYLYHTPEIIRPIPTECGVTQEELAVFVMEIDSLYTAAEATSANDVEKMFTETCFKDCVSGKDVSRLKILSADNRSTDMMEARAKKGENAQKIAWFWNQYNVGYKSPK